MLARMTWDQLLTWSAFAEIEPFGEERADLRAGIIASTIANVNRDPKKGRPFKPGDFMPEFGSAKRRAGKREPLMNVDDWNQTKRMAGLMAKAEG